MKRLPAAWIVAHLIWNGRVQSIWIADAALHAKTLNIKTQVYCSDDDLRPCWENQLHHWIEQHLKKIIKNHGFLLISGLGMIKRTPSRICIYLSPLPLHPSIPAGWEAVMHGGSYLFPLGWEDSGGLINPVYTWPPLHRILLFCKMPNRVWRAFIHLSPYSPIFLFSSTPLHSTLCVCVLLFR